MTKQFPKRKIYFLGILSLVVVLSFLTANTVRAVAGIDLDVTYIERTPKYPRYRVTHFNNRSACAPENPNYYPYSEDRGQQLCPDETNKKRWPSQGESVTFTAHVINKGNTSSGPFSYKWFIDNIEVGSGSHNGIAGNQEATFPYNWPWPHTVDNQGRIQGEHKIKFVVDPNSVIAEVSENNNTREEYTNALSLFIWAAQEIYDEYNSRRNVIGSYSFEDWIQEQSRKMQEVFTNSTYEPMAHNGVVEKVTIDKIVVIPFRKSINMGEYYSQGYCRDGNDFIPLNDPTIGIRLEDYRWKNDGAWGFGGIHPDYVKDYLHKQPTCPTTFTDDDFRAFARYSFDIVGTGYDWNLFHEITHQLGIIDLYNLDAISSGQYAINVPPDVRFSQPNGGLMNGGDTTPHNNPHFLSSHDVGALNKNRGFRRGFYGEYLFDIPNNNYLRVVDIAGQPISGATLQIYQKGIDSVFREPPVFTITTDASGRVFLENRRLGWTNTTITGHTLKDNPFGNINAVGLNGLFLLKIIANEQTEYQFLDITKFNLAYWSGATGDFVYPINTKILPGIPSPTNLALNKPAFSSGAAGSKTNPQYANDGNKIDSSRVWSAPPSAGSWWKVDLGANYNLYKVDIYPSAADPHRWYEKFHIEVSQTGAFSGEQTIVVTETQWDRTRTDRTKGGNDNYVSYVFNPVSGRYVRLVSDIYQTPVQLQEVEIFSVGQVPQITVSVDLKANGIDGPIETTSGSSIALSWVSTNATRCVASVQEGSDGWTGEKAIPAGQETIGLITSSKTYTLTCYGADNSSTWDNVRVEVSSLSVSLRAIPDRGPAPLTVNLTATVSGTATGNIFYAFDCTNNGTPDRSVGPTPSTSATTTCTYASPADYTASVTVSRENKNAQATAGITVTTQQPPLSVTLEAIPSSGTVPLERVDLKATVSGTATGNVNYMFDCTNDERIERSIISSENSVKIDDLCNYYLLIPYTAKVVVVRGEYTASATTGILVSPPAANNLPTAEAGPDKELFEEQTVVLQGSGSDPDNDPLTYSWSCTGGTLSNNTIAQPIYSAPRVTTDTSYTCTLEVSDGRGGAVRDNMTVSVINAINLALNKPASASGGRNPQYANDGDKTDPTRSWEAPDASGSWWKVDLLSSYNLNRVDIYPFVTNPRDWYDRFHIEVSQTGAFSGEQTTVATETDWPNRTYVSYSFNPVAGRYLRIVSDAAWTWVRLQEVEIFGVGLATPPGPAPSVDLKVNGQDGEGPYKRVNVAYNIPVTLSWTVSNATLCVLSIPSMPEPSQRIATIQNPTNSFRILGLLTPGSSYSYIIACSKPGEEFASDLVTINISSPPVATVDLKANNLDGSITIAYNNNFTLSWTTTNTNNCAAATLDGWSGWSGTKTATGLELIANVTVTRTYELTCYGIAGGFVTDSVTVNVSQRPTADIKANDQDGDGQFRMVNVNYNTPVTLSWVVANVSRCILSVPSAVDPSQRIVTLDNPATTGSLALGTLRSGWAYTYSLNCNNGAGEIASDLVLVNIAPATVTVDLKANNSDEPITIGHNSNFTLSWTSTNATNCTATTSPLWSGWSGTKTATGSILISNVTVTRDYNLSCSGTGGTATDSVTVNVLPAGAQPVGGGDGEGSLSLVSTEPSELHAGDNATYTFDFTVGQNGINPDGGIFLVLDGQVNNPSGANYLTVWRGSQQMSTELIPFKNNLNCSTAPACACLRTGDGILNPNGKTLIKIKVPVGLVSGEKIRIVYGDKTQGPGAAVGRHAQYETIIGIDNAQQFVTFVDGDGDCHASPITSTPTAKIYPRTATLVEAVLPSLVNANESTKLTIKAKDQYGNLAVSYRGTVNISKDNNILNIENLPTSYTFTEQDQGLHIFTSLIPRNTGIVRVVAQAGGLSAGESNPMEVTSNSGDKIYWGDFHVHTFESDGRFSLYKLYNDGKKRASLDFAASSDHTGWLTPTEWTTMNQVAEAFNESGVFVTFPSYEFTCDAQGGGQRNIVFPEKDGPVYYCSLFNQWPFLKQNPYENVAGSLLNNTGQLFADPVLNTLIQNNALTIPHHVSWNINGEDWNSFNKDLDRVVEIYSEHGSGEYYNNPLRHKLQNATSVELQATMTVQGGLAKGLRFGFIGASDDHYNTVPGGPRPAMLPSLTDCLNSSGGTKLCYKGGLAAVYSSSLTRGSLLSAIKSRHTYATTGGKIFVEFNAETTGKTYVMGDEFSSYTSPVFKGKVYGTNNLTKVEIVKGQVGNYSKDTPFPVVYSAPLSGKTSEFSWQDANLSQSAFYYLRVTQNPSSDSPDRVDMAWSSPIWVDKIANNPPTANAGPDQEVTEGQIVTLQGSGYDSDFGDTITYAWSCTGGTISYAYPSRAWIDYTAPMVSTDTNYTCTLTVNDNRGGTASDTMIVTVRNQVSPTLFVTFSANPSSGNMPLSVNLTANVSGSATGNITYYFDCTNNNTWEVAYGPVSQESFTAANACNYLSVDSYTAKARVTRGTLSAEATTVITVSAPAPTVDIKANNSDGPININSNTAATLSWTSTNADRCTASGDWSEDKAFSSVGESTGILTASKTYLLSCSGPGGTASDTVTVRVGPTKSANPLTVTLEAIPNSGSASLTVTLRATVSGSAIGNITYKFDCTNNGSWEHTFTSIPETSKTVTNACYYVFAGNYTARVAVYRGIYFDDEYVTINVTSPQQNNPPTARAGEDQTVFEGQTVTLDGSASSDPDNDPLTYSWSCTGGTLSNNAIAQPIYTAPQVTADTSYTCTLTVTDNHNASATDTMIVAVRNQSVTANLALNKPASASGGRNPQYANDGDKTDPTRSWEAPDASGNWWKVDLLSQYNLNKVDIYPFVTNPHDWYDRFHIEVSQTAAFAGEQTTVVTETHWDGTRADRNYVSYSFNPVAGRYLRIVSDAAWTWVRLQEVEVFAGGEPPPPTTNNPPIANAGQDQTVFEGQQATLNGSNSSDPDGDPITYQWSCQACPSGSLSNSNNVQATFTAPQVSVDTNYTFRLIVTDNRGASSNPDEAVVTVRDQVPPPEGPVNFYGTDINLLKIFGQVDFKETSRDTVVANKVYHAPGVLVDKSTRPNRIYVVDSGNNRVLGFDSLGYCVSPSNRKCTNDSDCPGSSCTVNTLRNADLIFGQPDASTASCNGDNNLGINKNPTANTLCFIPYPTAPNIAEYWMRNNFDVDSGGNLYILDTQNNRILKFNQPFSLDKSNGKGDTIPDFVWGQDNFDSGRINKGMGWGSRNRTSLFVGEGGSGSARGVSVDPDGNIWAADTFNNRVLRFPANSREANLVLGQANFESLNGEPCNLSPETRPLNQVCNPTLARVNPETGKLYVLDEKGGYPFETRILVFNPPFTNGMRAEKMIVPRHDTMIINWEDEVPQIFCNQAGDGQIKNWDTFYSIIKQGLDTDLEVRVLRTKIDSSTWQTLRNLPSAGVLKTQYNQIIVNALNQQHNRGQTTLFNNESITFVADRLIIDDEQFERNDPREVNLFFRRLYERQLITTDSSGRLLLDQARLNSLPAEEKSFEEKNIEWFLVDLLVEIYGGRDVLYKRAYNFQSTGFVFNSFREGGYAAGVLWLNEHSANRTLLIDDEGNIIKVIGAPDKYHRGCYYPYYGNTCTKDITKNFNLCEPGGQIGFDNANNIYLADDPFNRIARFALPYNTYPVGNNQCLPDANGGLFDGTAPNSVSGYKFSETVGTLVFNGNRNQLIVKDRERYLIWEDYLNKPMYQEADIVIGQNNKNERLSNEFQLGARAFHTIDDKNRLWTFNGHGSIVVYQLPFRQGDRPIANFVRLYWGDVYTNPSAGKMDYRGSGIAFDRFHNKIWITDNTNHRLLRIGNYDDIGCAETEPNKLYTGCTNIKRIYVDMVIGQPDKEHTCCNQKPKESGICQPSWHANYPPRADTLCEPTHIKFDNYGNLYVVENAYECHGNTRITVFMKEDIENARGLFPNISARKVFVSSSFTQMPICGRLNEPESPVSIAFNSRNQMVIANDGGYPIQEERFTKQLWLYLDPLKKNPDQSFVQGQKPDYSIRVIMGAPGEISFDNQDNLIIQDHTWMRVWLINLDRDSYWLVPTGAIPPTVDIKANNSDGPITINYNSSATLSWTSTNATNCTASSSSNDWTGAKNTFGSEPTGTLTVSKTYTLACSGAGGSSSDSVTVNVEIPLSVTLEAIPNSGTVPLTGVDLRATVSGTATGNMTYFFACRSNGQWDRIIYDSPDTSKTIEDLCTYDASRTYEAKAAVTRGIYTSNATTAIAVVVHENHNPIADAGPDKEVLEGQTVILEGSGSDPDSGDTFTYSWLCTGGTLSDSRIARPTFTAPSVTADTDYYCDLTVTDNHQASGTDRMKVRVIKQTLLVSLAANPGTLPLSANLTATVSGTAVGAITYIFDCDTNTTAIDYTFTTPDSLKATVCTYDSGGTYEAEVRVTRGLVASVNARTNVTITVLPEELTVDLKVNASDGPVTIINGGSVVLSWRATSATSCTASRFTISQGQGWSGNKPTQGSETMDYLYFPITYRLICSDSANNSVRDMVTVNIASSLTTLSVNVSADPNSGRAPLSNVDLILEAFGTASGYITYSVDCQGDGSFERRFTYISDNRFAAKDVCSYQAVGTYAANVMGTRGGTWATTQTIIDVTTIAAVNTAPTANAGPDKEVLEGKQVKLEGSASDLESDILTYSWSCDGGTLSDYKIIQPIYTAPQVDSDTIYLCTLTVSDGKLSNRATVRITVKNQISPLPTVDLKVNNSNGPITIDYNASATLSWTSTNTTNCTASSSSNDWTGAKNTFGSEPTGNLTSAKTYTLTCSGTGGSATDSVTVNVTSAPIAPTVDLKANNSDGPITIDYNTFATLSWTFANASSGCTASNGWTGAKNTSGSEPTGSLTFSKTYTLTCSGTGGTASDTVMVNVLSSPAGQYPISVPVLVLKYFPLTGTRLDLTITGVDMSLDEARTKVGRMTSEIITSLKQGSTYHSYKDASATASLEYGIVDTKEFLYAIPKSTEFAPFPDHLWMLDGINICDYVDNRGVKEVWIWMYHTDVIAPIESNMSMGTNIRNQWNFPDYGDVSNSYRQNDLPICRKTYTVYDYNYGRETPQAVEDHLHQIESLFRSQYGDNILFWDKFVNPYLTTSSYGGETHGCGWSHYPPNGRSDYDWSNSQYVWSDCEDWKPDRTGQRQYFNCDKWRCRDPGFGDLRFFTWWMQNVPGKNNSLTYNLRRLKNWWDFVGDFDRTVTEGNGLIYPAGANNPPTAMGGPNKEVLEGQTVRLDGSASDPDSDALTYSWSCDGGTLSDYKTIQPIYTAPQVDSDTIYLCTLTVSDGKSSASATVKITVRNQISPAPTVDLKANNSNGPITIDYNTSATLSWTSTNSTGCTASGDWWGSKPTSGSQSTVNLTSAKTYTISCSGAGGTATDSVTVNVTAPPSAPTVDLKANNSDGPITINYNTAVTLSWTSTNATTCTASSSSNDWTGAKNTVGSESTGNLTSAKTYTLTCSGTGGSATDSVTVNVGAQPTLSVNLTANPASGNAPLDVNLTAAVSGTATGNLSFKFDCTNDGTWDYAFTNIPDTSKTVACRYLSQQLYTARVYVERGVATPVEATTTINVTVIIPLPTVDLKANNSNGPITIGYNTAATLSWTSTNAISCTASSSSNDWTGAKNTVGSESTGNLTVSKTYTLTCTGAGGTANDTVTVNVIAPANNPPTANAGPDKEVVEGQTVILQGSGSDPDNDPLTYSWSCTSGTLSNNVIAQPTYTAPQVTADTNYTCTLTVNDGRGGTANDTMIVTVRNQVVPLPTVDLKANNSNGPITIGYNTAATLSWTSTNAISCTASSSSNDWTGAKNTVGSESTGNLTVSKTYTLTCTGAGGSASDSVTVNVGTQPTLFVSLSADPSSGTAPLSGVDLIATVFGTATGPITYYLDCMNDNNWEIGYGPVTNESFRAADACNYSAAGSYQAKARVTRETLSAEATITIVVSAPPPLSVVLEAIPSSGTTPLNGVDLKATVSGTAGGTIELYFYCNRSDEGTNVTYPYARYNSTTNTSFTAVDVCNYSSAGTYTAKVLVIRGGYFREARVSLVVSLP